jgi:hypothetical protein
MKMDSLVINQFRPGTEIIESEKVVKYDPAALKEAGLSKKPAMSFSKEMISLFKKYGVYYISRGVRSFSLQDTLPHYKTTKRKGRFLTQRTNYNKSLTIKFTEKSSTEKFAKLLSRLKGVRRVGLNEKVMEFFVPNDPDYINESGGIDQQKYMGSEVMNFEGAWDFIRGDAQPNIPITIAVIDTDFDNLFWVEDLKGNMNTNSPDFSGGSGSGHGIAVASVACAATNNESLIAGATHNSQFMPFLRTDKGSIRKALQTIKDNHDDGDDDNDCYVVNMSFSYSEIHDDIKDLCDELYNEYGVLLVAAVSDVSGGGTNIAYPAGHSSVIGVGASAKSDNKLLEISNYGDDVEVVATGESILHLKQWDNDWDVRSGTSLTAPFVSSLCALILTTEKGWELTNNQIRQQMINRADIITDHNKTFYRINAAKTLDSVTPIRDYVAISGDKVLKPKRSYYFYSDFYRISDKYITGGWKWRLGAETTTGFETWVSGTTSGQTSSVWKFTVPTIIRLKTG